MKRPNLRVPAMEYLVRHPDVSYCDECLYQVAAQEHTERQPWGDISVERADGVCARCKRQTTVSTGRRMGTLADFAPGGDPKAHEQPIAGVLNVTEPSHPHNESVVPIEAGVMDLVLRALLLTKREALKQARDRIDAQIARIDAEIHEFTYGPRAALRKTL